MNNEKRNPTSSVQSGRLRKYKIGLCCALFAGSLFFSQISPVAMAATAPTIKLFPSTVVENIKSTSSTAQAMEENLHTVIKDLETQMALYNDSQCEGNEMDEGCRAIIGQVSNKYLEMLSKMEEKLPEMERSVKQTSKSLEKNIRAQLGMKMTPRQLQTVILKNSRKNPAAQVGRKNRDMRLSKRFEAYYNMVAMGGRAGGGGSLVAVASNIYLDTKEVSDLIGRTREEISRAKLMVELNRIYGVVTPEMSQVVNGVKSVIFGESEATPGIPDPLPGIAEGHFRSPLEI